MCIINSILKLIVPLPKLTKHERYLFVSPHPDDIEVGAGATVATLIAMGKQVDFLICTDGRYGTSDVELPAEELVKIRQEETLASAKFLGVNSVTFLPYHDCGSHTEEELMLDIAKVIARLKPDIVFCPDPHLKTECHIDHVKTGKAASYACLRAGNVPMMAKEGLANHAIKGIAFYYTDSPNNYVKVGKNVKKQEEALRLYKSQFPIDDSGKSDLDGILLYIKFRAIRFGIRTLKGRAEGFRTLAPTHMHCCSEDI